MFKVLVIGGGGYVGSALCPALAAKGHKVVAYDTFWYGQHALPHTVRKVVGDIRDVRKLRFAMERADAVIHLACISNDPSFDLNPDLGKSINLESFPAICKLVKEQQVRRFIYASSSSVYGIKEGTVTEEISCNPLTDYSKFKLSCENHLRQADMGYTTWTIVRPATICGAAPRLRLDLIVNLLTAHGITDQKISIHGGDQQRPNLNIKDMVSVYSLLLESNPSLIHKQIFNVGADNYSVQDIAQKVRRALADPEIVMEYVKTLDNRSYHISSDKIWRTLSFRPHYTIEDAVLSLKKIFPYLTNPIDNPRYWNIKMMKELKIS